MVTLNGRMGARALNRIASGFRVLYRDGEQNHCPACGGGNWIIGRLTAECSFCTTALPLQHAHSYGCCSRFNLSGQSDLALPEMDTASLPAWRAPASAPIG